MIDKLLDKIYYTIESICKLMLVLMVVVVAYTVFGRFVLNDSPSWGEEIGIFILVWIALLSISLGIRDGRHIRITILEIILPEKVNKILNLVGNLFIMFVSIVMLIEGTKLTLLSLNVNMPAMGISQAWLYVVVPISGLAILLMLVAKVRDEKWF